MLEYVDLTLRLVLVGCLAAMFFTARGFFLRFLSLFADLVHQAGKIQKTLDTSLDLPPSIDAELSSIKTRLSTVETDMDTKYKSVNAKLWGLGKHPRSDEEVEDLEPVDPDAVQQVLENMETQETPVDGPVPRLQPRYRRHK